ARAAHVRGRAALPLPGRARARRRRRCALPGAVPAHRRDRRRALGRARPEPATNLASLYGFAEERIREAMRAETPAPLAPARDVLTTLLDGWKGLEIAT